MEPPRHDPSGPVQPEPQGLPQAEARQLYRRRRLMDAARLIPMLGIALVLLPVLWVPGNRGAGTAAGVVYLFLIWLGLIALGALVAYRLSSPRRPPRGTGE